MMRALFWPWLTAARRGARDRRDGFPTPGAGITMRIHAHGDAEMTTDVTPFGTTIISAAEEMIDALEARRWAMRGPKLNAEASHITDQARPLADELSSDKKRYATQHGDRPFPERHG